MWYSIPKFLSDRDDWRTFYLRMREGADSFVLQLHEGNNGMERALLLFLISDEYENAWAANVKYGNVEQVWPWFPDREINFPHAPREHRPPHGSGYEMIR